MRGIYVPILIAASALASSSCIFEPHIPRDYWSEIIEPCGYLIPRERSFPYPPRDETSLTAPCRAALEAILPFHESFDDAPAGLKSHVIEAFQVLAAYPVEFTPDNTILGVAPHSIPLATICLFDPGSYPDECRIDPDYEAYLYEIPDGDPRRISRNLFNRALNRFDEIRYGGADSAFASLVPFPTEEGTSYRLTIYDPFWTSGSYSVTNSPFERAATLVHESRHGDGYHHKVDFCGGGIDCDPTLGSCYGTEAIYRLMLIKGSYGLTVGGKAAMTNWDVFTLGLSACSSLLANLEPGRLPPELAGYLETEQCSFSANDILESLGLENAFD